jgi:hypothetical protein
MSNYTYPSQRPSGSGTFSDNLVGLQITDGGGLTQGNFKFTTTVVEKTNRNYSVGVFSEPISLETLGFQDTTQAKSIFDNNFKLFPNFDETDVSNFVGYGSLSKRFEAAISNIINYFPASIDVSKYRPNFVTGATATGITYNGNENETKLIIPLETVRNPFSVNYTNTSTQTIESLGYSVSKYRDMSKTFLSYVLVLNSNQYPVTFMTPSTSISAGTLTLYVQGNPFSGLSTYSEFFLIRPNDTIVNEVFNLELEEIEEILLNRLVTPIYTYVATVPSISDSGLFYDSTKKLTFPLDGPWNLDIRTNAFISYIENLQLFALDYDNYRTNIISRFYTTNAFKEFDTSDQKVDKVLKIYGRSFDETKKYADAIQHVTSVNYNIGNDIPSGLLTNFAETLGWKKNISPIADSNFLESVYGTTENAFPAYSTSQTKLDLNYQYYRNLLINSAYLFKSNGTRKSIEFLLNFIGTPEALLEFNENVYLVDNKINMTRFNQLYQNISGGLYVTQFPSIDTTNVYGFLGNTYNGYSTQEVIEEVTTTRNDYPVDSEGYPTKPTYSNDYFFQKGAGWIQSTPQHRSPQTFSANTNVFTGQNLSIQTSLEPFTYGEKYLERFRNFPSMELGFSIKKVIDNKKSWYNQTSDLRKNTDDLFDAYYTVSDDRYVLNVKNTDIFLNPAQALAYDVWYLSNTKNYPIPFTGLSSPYPQIGGTDWTFINPQPQVEDFFEFYKTFWMNMINVRNRQYSSDGKTSGYPTLQSLFWKYLTMYQDVGIQNNNFTYQNMINYINGLGSFWINLIEQFVPATTIWNTGTKLENSIFHRQKFIYRMQKGCQIVLQEVVGPVSTGTISTNNCNGVTFPLPIPTTNDLDSAVHNNSEALAALEGFGNGYTTISALYGFEFTISNFNGTNSYTFTYNDSAYYYTPNLTPTEAQWTNIINQGILYFASSGQLNDAGIQIILDSNDNVINIVTLSCEFSDWEISDFTILTQVSIQGP